MTQPAPGAPEGAYSAQQTVTIADHPVTALNGTIVFRAPSIYDDLAIQRRIVELANTGARADSPRFSPEELGFTTYRRLHILSTLEHVMQSAPAGFYRKGPRGEPILDLGMLDPVEYEDENEGVLWQLYAAYDVWRTNFRNARRRAADRPQDAPGQ